MVVAAVTQYLAALPEDRRNALTKVRAAIAKSVPKGYVETIEFGMISWVVPLSRYPNTYNGRPLILAALGSQKNHMAVYLMGIYGDPKLRASFESAYRATGKRFDVGKSCVRFKSLNDLPLQVIMDAVGAIEVDAFTAAYERARSPNTAGNASATKKAPAPRKSATKTAPARKPTAKMPAAKKAPAAKRTAR